MEIAKKGIQIIMISAMLLATSAIQYPLFQLFAILVVAAILIKNGGDVRKF